MIWGDDIGTRTSGRYNRGLMELPHQHRPHRERGRDVHRLLRRGRAAPPDARRSSPARACFRTGLSKVGMPGSTIGLQPEDPTIAELLKPLGYATGQFGKNHLGDRNEFLPTVHGFDEFFGNLYHLNAEEEPEHWITRRRLPRFNELFAARGVIHRKAPTRTTRPSRPALRSRRQAADRGHGSADQEAHGDDRRRNRQRPHRLHQAPARGRQALLRVDQHDAHAPADTPSRRASARQGAGSRRTTTP